jgi:hypothetical protein
MFSLPPAADGSQVVAGVGNRVLVYDAVDGDLQHALKGHKVQMAGVQAAHALQQHGSVATLIISCMHAGPACMGSWHSVHELPIHHTTWCCGMVAGCRLLRGLLPQRETLRIWRS